MTGSSLLTLRLALTAAGRRSASNVFSLVLATDREQRTGWRSSADGSSLVDRGGVTAPVAPQSPDVKDAVGMARPNWRGHGADHISDRAAGTDSMRHGHHSTKTEPVRQRAIPNVRLGA
jgi:hypothetical protein